MSVRKEVLHSNAKALLGKPAKRVWFRLNPLLEKTSLFASRRQDNSQFTLPLQSVVICERFLEDKSAFQSTCTEADFWDYLWSENWRDWSSVRVFEGQLFDSLLEGLYALEEGKTVKSHTTSVFTENIRHAKKTLKGCPELITITEQLKISFTYYGKGTEVNRPTSRPSVASSSETMSVPGFEDLTISDDEIFPSETEADGEDDVKPELRDGSFTMLTKGEVLPLRQGKAKGRPKTKTPKDLSSENSFQDVTIPQTGSRLSPYTPFKDWVKSRESSKPPSASSVPGERSPYQHTMYTLPHFRCSRPNRLHNAGITPPNVVKESVSLEDERPKDDDRSLWLIDVMKHLPSSGERTVDRLRKRLEELRIKRDKAVKKEKPKFGEHFLEVVNLVNTYGNQAMLIPRLLRCEKVPTFRQYIVQIIEDKTFDPRFRNKRRVQKFSKRYNLQSLSDFSMDPSTDDTNTKEDLKKTNKKKTKGQQKKVKPRKEPSKSNLVSELTTQNQSPERGSMKPEPPSCEFVDIVVGITDCKAFRQPLAEITEEGTADKKEIILKLKQEAAREDVNYTDELDMYAKNTFSPTSHQFSALTMTPESESLDGGLAGSYRSPSKRSTDFMLMTRADPMFANRTKKRKRRPNENGHDEEDDGHFDSASHSPLNTWTPVPEIFDASKLNRKYSFEKLKEAQSNKKPKFKDILKKFVKIQKVAAVFRKGAMLKSKRRKFVNPLQMSPSPDSSMHFMGKVTYRREALISDMELPSFKSFSVVEFREQLLKALDTFVVRKEQVTSSYKTRRLTSITFTRPEVFTVSEH